MKNNVYVYIYLDPRKPGEYKYGKYIFGFEPIYVGKGKGWRINDHINYVKSNKPRTRNRLKFNKIRKILDSGYEPIAMKIANNLSDSDAYNLERELISLIGRIDLETGPLTNLTDGGEGECGYKFTEDQRAHLSQAHTGKRLTKEHKRNIGLAVKRRWENEEYRELMSSVHTGKKMSKSSIEKRVNTYKLNGGGKWMIGRSLPESTKKKMSESARSTKSTLTEDDVIRMRELFDTNEHTQTELSKMFSVSVQVVHYIVRRKTWRYI